MGTQREPAVTVVACGRAVLVAKDGQQLVVDRDAWRQFLADVKAGRWDRPR
jgi:hypothetical protein